MLQIFQFVTEILKSRQLSSFLERPMAFDGEIQHHTKMVMYMFILTDLR